MDNQIQENLIQKAVRLAGGPTAVGRKCGGISYQAVRKWEDNGRMPRTEWTGETKYCQKIIDLIEENNGKGASEQNGICRESLLSLPQEQCVA